MRLLPPDFDVRDSELAHATITGRLRPLLPIGSGIRLRRRFDPLGVIWDDSAL